MIRTLQKVYRLSTIRQKIRLERETRLAKGIDAKNLTMKSNEDLTKIRNIGIIAHIDAGKTTTTQRMLYYAGALPSPGNIDQGTTAMDYLAQERERGITIRSAAISFNWLDHQINLIDTPGHVDFSGEVTRSLRVLDGVVTILDGVKGVEAQTQKVWAQATKHKLPKICFVNKMDRIGSSIQFTSQTLKNKLGIQPLILQAPIGDGDSFKGVYDLVQMEQIIFSGKYGQNVQKTKLLKNTQKHNYVLKLRQSLIELVGNYDDQIADMYLKQQFVPPSRLKIALRKILTNPKHALKASPVLMGASVRNIGVQPLLDYIISLMPSPVQRQPLVSEAEGHDNIKRNPNKSQPFLGYVFKVLFDLEKGPLVYTRVYSGYLNKKLDIYNSTKKLHEKVGQVLRVRANTYVPIQQISAGDIVALSGLTQTGAGDTLTSNGDQFLLQKLQNPNPVFTAPFELQTSKFKRQFDEAMRRSVIEDTTLTYKYQNQTAQYLVSGLGELHLQILKDRLISEGIPVKMGKLKINFKQTIDEVVTDQIKVKNQIKPGVFEEFMIQISLMPLRTQDDKIQGKNQVVFGFERVPQFDQHWKQFVIKKRLATHPRQRQNFTKQQLSKLKKNVRNPQPMQPIYQPQPQLEQSGQKQTSPAKQPSDDQLSQDQQENDVPDQQAYYSISTLPFDTLHQLVTSLQTSLLSGRNSLPTTGIVLQIKQGQYRKSSFSKALMNKCASTLTRNLLQKTVIIEPIMSFTLQGQEVMLEHALKDVLKKRGRVEERGQGWMKGAIPAQGVRGWIGQLRAMGLEIQVRFLGYEGVIGVDGAKLIQDNL